MADIALRSTQLSDGWGVGYRPVGTPTSPRYTVSKTITDHGDGTATITLNVTIKTNDGYVGGGYTLTLNFSIAGNSTVSKVWKASSGNWNKNSTYSTTISQKITLDGAASRTADLWLTINSGTYFTFRTSTQGGDSITGIPLGYQVATFTKFNNFSSTASAIAVTVRERTSSLKNKMTLKIGTTTIRYYDNLDDVDSLPLSSANHAAIHAAIPNSLSATATLIMETMNGTTVIGTVTRTATVSIAADQLPTIGSFTAAETVTAVAAVLGAGVYARNLSRPRFTTSGVSAPHGATIKSYQITFNGETWNKATSDPAQILNWSGSNKNAVVTVTDSRGREATKSVGINPLAYSLPTLTGVQARRASNTGGTVSDEGVYLRIDRASVISALGNKNQLTLKIEHKLTTSSSWIQSYSNTWGLGTNSISGQTTVTAYTYSIEQSFDVRVSISDKFNTVRAEASISSAEFPLVIGKYGVGIGKVPEGSRRLDMKGTVIHGDGEAFDLKSMSTNIGLLGGAAIKNISTINASDNFIYFAIKKSDGTSELKIVRYDQT